jgi:hypothetical protein
MWYESGISKKYMNLNIKKPNVILFSHSTNSVHFHYHIG